MGNKGIFAIISEKLKQDLDIHCAITGKKQKEVIALAIEKYLKEQEK